jgi:hypothetical protein
LLSQIPGACRVNEPRDVEFGFRAIHGCIRRGIEYDGGLNAANQRSHRIRICDIECVAIDSDNGAQAGKTAFQFAAKLSGTTDNQNALPGY